MTGLRKNLLLHKRGKMAEGEGFEPPEPFPAQRFSRPPHSTTLPPHLGRVTHLSTHLIGGGLLPRDNRAGKGEQ